MRWVWDERGVLALLIGALWGCTMALSVLNVGVAAAKTSASGPQISGLNVRTREKTQKESKNGLSKADNAYISELVTNVTKIREHFESSGMSEKLLAERIEAMQNRESDSGQKLAADVTCPPPGFTSISPFSIKDYISASWYVQEQQLVSYQPPSTLFCVKATYIPRDPKNLSAGLDVYNYANFGAVNGFAIGGANDGLGIFSLKASIKNISMPSMLSVGPYFGGVVGLTLDFLGLSFLPNAASGPYWVVAAGPKKFGEEGFDGYKWAIVSGGAPETPSNGACKTGRNLPWPLEFSGVGYWYLTRDQVASPELLAEMRAVGKSLGYDNSVLLPVEQKGCKYEGSKNVDPSLLL